MKAHVIRRVLPIPSQLLVLASILLLLSSESAWTKSTSAEEAAKEILEGREELDKTIWVDEVEAQEYEAVFVEFWDRIRAADAAGKFDVLAEFPLQGEVSYGTSGVPEELDLGVRQTSFKTEPQRVLSSGEWGKFVRSFRDSGFEIIQTEWHHSRFVPGSSSTGAQSTISFAIHAKGEDTRSNYQIKGDLKITWMPMSPDHEGGPVAESISVENLKLQAREGEGSFREVLVARHAPDEWISAYPVIVYDLDNDGLSEIILPRWNRVYWNKGERMLKKQFEEETFVDFPIDIWEAGILSDFNGDGHADFVTVGKDGSLYCYAGSEKGSFPDKPKNCSKVHFEMPTAITAGDVDGDGDLDLWVTQYKLSFVNGQMPTPYYDANDGHPSYLLLNDGSGSFSDATEEAGLAPLRNRRTYSTSFVDIDDDGDLDLINVSDYAGLDIYENSGDADFRLATNEFVNERHFFGMGHTFGDYNNDGRLDFYVIGMSSTTARRLDRLKLGREDRPDIHPMRSPMGYGNRLYFGTDEKAFREDPKVAAAVARTGWSWGATSFDFDLDGDQDIYVANGHRSGKSCKDYCTTFWRHDIYTGDSKESQKVLKVFESTLLDLNQDEISWNGYEKNVLFTNHQERPEIFVNSAFLFDSAFAFDARSVISDDLNADGRPDLIVAESRWNGRGSELIIRAFQNELIVEPSGNWFSVRLRESAGPGYSPNGAKVAITDDAGRVQTRWIVTGDSFLCQHAPTAHFGLGASKGVESIEVTWPNGQVETHAGRGAVNTSITLQGGSKSE